MNKIYNEDCLQTMARMPDKFVDCVITSPPYWQLRDYNWDGQWGLERTYQEYLEHLWMMMDEIWRVLKDTGTVWVNLGDTYARGSREKCGNNDTLHDQQATINPKTKPDYQGLDKCLLLIPHRFAIGCIERNWILRNDINWGKRNGMPESVTDRFSKKHEYIFFFVKQQKYYFDLEKVRDKNPNWKKDYKRVLADYNGGGKKHTQGGTTSFKTKDLDSVKERLQLGKNPGDVSDFWDIPTQPSNEKHYATFNTKLIDKPIIAGCPENGIILDPFCGTGTTLIRGLQLNRRVIGIDGKKEYCEIAQKRINQELAQLKLKL